MLIRHKTGHFAKECKIRQQFKQRRQGLNLWVKAKLTMGKVRAQVQTERGKRNPKLSLKQHVRLLIGEQRQSGPAWRVAASSWPMERQCLW